MGKALKIPSAIAVLVERLKQAGFSAYLVGGCVRDLLLKRQPKDWDIATNARPEQIQALFPGSVYENQFGTVLVKLPEEKESEVSEPKVVEVTTFRIEGKYSDKRHPDEIQFAQTIEEDLSRRDFTINAMAIALSSGKAATSAEPVELIDPFQGQLDLKNRLIRAVGKPAQRFQEDALRLIRAVRFVTELNSFIESGSAWKIEKETEQAIKKNAGLLKIIAKERVRDELIKILMTAKAKLGIELLEELGLLELIIPELREGIGVTQNLHHLYSVWEHNLLSLDYAAQQNFSLELRLAALFHDIGKPRTKRGQGREATFYSHEIVGARMTRAILTRLHFPREVIAKAVQLVRYHLFYYNVGEVTEAGVRRFISRVGLENVDDLLKLRQADRIGSGVPKAVPYKIRHLQFMIEKVRRDPISAKMLKINGHRVMELLKIPPGPKVGWLLSILLDEVIEQPGRNTSAYLEERLEQLGRLSDKELAERAKLAQTRKQEFESGVEQKMKQKYYVK